MGLERSWFELLIFHWNWLKPSASHARWISIFTQTRLQKQFCKVPWRKNWVPTTVWLETKTWRDEWFEWVRVAVNEIKIANSIAEHTHSPNIHKFFRFCSAIGSKSLFRPMWKQGKQQKQLADSKVCQFLANIFHFFIFCSACSQCDEWIGFVSVSLVSNFVQIWMVATHSFGCLSLVATDFVFVTGEVGQMHLTVGWLDDSFQFNCLLPLWNH